MADLLNQMKEAELDLAAAGDMAGAHMLGEIIEDYRAGIQPEGNARIALGSARRRLSRTTDSENRA